MNMENVKRIPYGVSNFVEAVTQICDYAQAPRVRQLKQGTKLHLK